MLLLNKNHCLSQFCISVRKLGILQRIGRKAKYKVAIKLVENLTILYCHVNISIQYYVMYSIFQYYKMNNLSLQVTWHMVFIYIRGEDLIGGLIGRLIDQLTIKCCKDIDIKMQYHKDHTLAKFMIAFIRWRKILLFQNFYQETCKVHILKNMMYLKCLGPNNERSSYTHMCMKIYIF